MLEKAVSYRGYYGRKYLLEAFSLLPFEVDFFEMTLLSTKTKSVFSFITRRFPNTRSARFLCPMREFSVCQVSRLKRLESLYLKNIFIDTCDFTIIGEECPKLHTLSITMPYVNNDKEGVEVLSEIDHLDSLTSLTLASCDTLNDFSLEKISNGCRKLLHLNLENSRSFSGASLCRACQYCGSLTSLDLSDCSNMTDDTILSFSNSLARLRKLKLRNNTDITWNSINHLWSRMDHLELLAVPNCASIDFSCILLSMLTRKYGLLTLDVSSNPSVTDDVVAALDELCPDISELSVKNCPFLTDASVFIFKVSFPSLQRLKVGGVDGVMSNIVEGSHSGMTAQALRDLKKSRGREFAVIDAGLSEWDWSSIDAEQRELSKKSSQSRDNKSNVRYRKSKNNFPEGFSRRSRKIGRGNETKHVQSNKTTKTASRRQIDDGNCYKRIGHVNLQHDMQQKCSVETLTNKSNSNRRRKRKQNTSAGNASKGESLSDANTWGGGWGDGW